jgi:gluconate 5-dehydrogenase
MRYLARVQGLAAMWQRLLHWLVRLLLAWQGVKMHSRIGRNRLGNKAGYVCHDLMVRDEMPVLAEKVSAIFGAPDIIIHAAGINHRQHADEVTAQGWDDTIWLNLSVPFFLSQQFVPAMKARKWGRIVTFASLQTTRAFPSGIAYGASKGELDN